MKKIKLADKQEILNKSTEALEEYLKSILVQIDKISFKQLKDFCTPLKEYYRLTGQKILPGTASYDFLVCFFGKYHPNWDEKTHGADVEYFHVEIAEQGNTFCFYLYIGGIREDIGYSQIALKFKKINDIKRACREAIHPLITDFKKKMLESVILRCPITGELLNTTNMAVHHEVFIFDDIVTEWVDINGGEDEVFKYVNQTVGNGTVTKFTDKKLINDFVDYHNKHTKVCVLSERGHKIRHQEIKASQNGNSSLKEYPIDWYTLPLGNNMIFNGLP